jgi:hypothetical protein
MTASEYMHKVRALADSMASAGSPLRDDEIIDYMLTGLCSTFNPIAASLNMATRPVTAIEFYSMVLNYEGLQLSQQGDSEEWSSSANAVSRGGQGGAPWHPRAPATPPPQPGYDGGTDSCQNYGGHNPGSGQYNAGGGGYGQPYGQQGGGNNRPTTAATAETAAVVATVVARTVAVVVSVHSARSAATGDMLPRIVGTATTPTSCAATTTISSPATLHRLALRPG